MLHRNHFHHCISHFLLPPLYLRPTSNDLFSNHSLLLQLQVPATVRVGNRDVAVTNATINDQSATIEIAMWRELSSTPLLMNSTYSFSHMSISTYNNRRRASTTRHSNILVSIPHFTNSLSLSAKYNSTSPVTHNLS